MSVFRLNLLVYRFHHLSLFPTFHINLISALLTLSLPPSNLPFIPNYATTLPPVFLFFLPSYSSSSPTSLHPFSFPSFPLAVSHSPASYPPLPPSILPPSFVSDGLSQLPNLGHSGCSVRPLWLIHYF